QRLLDLVHAWPSSGQLAPLDAGRSRSDPGRIRGRGSGRRHSRSRKDPRAPGPPRRHPKEREDPDMVDILAFVVGGLRALAPTPTVALWRAMAAVRARPPRGGRRLPPMLVIRPVRGLEPGLAGNVAAALAQRYPGRLETIFVLDDPDDP